MPSAVQVPVVPAKLQRKETPQCWAAVVVMVGSLALIVLGLLMAAPKGAI